MEKAIEEFEIEITLEEDFITIKATGVYSLTNAMQLFKTAIDQALLHNKSKILVDVNLVTGSIPFLDRYEFAAFVAKYKMENALNAVSRIAACGKEPIIDKGKFGETVAINRGLDARVFTEFSEAISWLKNTDK